LSLGRNRSDLVIFVGKRLLQLVPVLFGVVTITFFFTHVAVPNPCAAWTKARTPGAVQACVVTFGFDKPLSVQYTTYLQNLISGNWGTNSVQQPVLPSILRAFPETLELVFASLLLMVVLGIPLGVVAANGAGRWPDHLVLPATALAFLNMGIGTRMTRGSMLEILPMDFVKTARMKGLTNFWVLYRHALRNSLISTTTVLGIAAGGLLSGTVVIENIFRWPGIGTYAFNAIIGYEFAETIGIVIVLSVGVVLAQLVLS